ncbi:helix-turn-helix transcriptional regulator [Mycobacterium heidelbergense]|nr:helix-turn-helix transcriptional regulator [Mycobacterium heidelbergense]
MREMDRVYAMNLAMIRKAAQLTQEDLAARLGKGQAAVSKLERQNDLLLSTLASYIHAAGAEAQLVVTVAGTEIRYDLEQLGTADDSVATTG